MQRCAPVAVRQPFPDFEDLPLKEGESERYRSPVVSYTIKENGETANLKLERSTGIRSLDAGVLKAVRRWKYNPRPGCPDIEATLSLTIDFR